MAKARNKALRSAAQAHRRQRTTARWREARAVVLAAEAAKAAADAAAKVAEAAKAVVEAEALVTADEAQPPMTPNPIS